MDCNKCLSIHVGFQSRFDPVANLVSLSHANVAGNDKVKLNECHPTGMTGPKEGRGRVFRFHHLKHLLTRAKLAALGIPCPARRPIGWCQPTIGCHGFCNARPSATQWRLYSALN